ncbi:MAG: aldose epimerase family protein [Pirellulales bacterium]
MKHAPSHNRVLLLIAAVTLCGFVVGCDSPSQVTSAPVAQADEAAEGAQSPQSAAPGQSNPASGEATMNVSVSPYGTTPDGTAVEVYTLESGNGVTARVITYGATLIGVDCPDRDGKRENVVLGYGTLEDYIEHGSYFGSTVGRYANRIASGRFALDGTTYELATNNGPNHLHGGPTGFHARVWNAEQVRTGDAVGAKFTYTSADGEEGFPGKLDVAVTYTLDGDGRLRIEYEATTDKPTHCNLTNHSYFNLAGHGSGDVLEQVLELHCNQYLPTDETLIPTGELYAVAGTPYDFTQPKKIGADIAQQEGLYDVCYVIQRDGGGLVPVARATDPASGRVLDVESTEPGVQLYTANHLSEVPGRDGATYNKHQAFCLETQHYPDAPNQPDFPSTVLRPGETYRSTTVYRFYAE